MLQKYSAMLLEMHSLYLKQFVFESIVSNGKLMDKQCSDCIKLDQLLLQVIREGGAKKDLTEKEIFLLGKKCILGRMVN